MTTNKSSHEKCLHPATKSARAKCRRERAAWETLMAPTAADLEFAAIRALADEWESRCEIFASAHVDSAHQNADDTSAEEGFEYLSRRWYESALGTLESARDNAERVYRQDDPERGQALRLSDEDDWFWVDEIRYENGWAAELTIVDRAGNRRQIKPADIDLDA